MALKHETSLFIRSLSAAAAAFTLLAACGGDNKAKSQDETQVTLTAVYGKAVANQGFHGVLGLTVQKEDETDKPTNNELEILTSPNIVSEAVYTTTEADTGRILFRGIMYCMNKDDNKASSGTDLGLSIDQYQKLLFLDNPLEFTDPKITSAATQICADQIVDRADAPQFDLIFGFPQG